MGQQQTALAQVVQRQRGKGDQEPGQANRLLAEVAHVGVQRLGARQRQHHGAQGNEGNEAVIHQEGRRVQRIERGQDGWRLDDVDHAHAGQRGKPQHHDGGKIAADAGRAVRLYRIQRHQHHHRQRHHIRTEGGRGHFQALDRRQHGNGRRNHAVAIEQGGAEDADHHQREMPARQAADGRQHQRHQGHDAALAAVIGAQHQGHVLERDDQGQAPENQRDNTQQVLGRQHQAVGRVEDGLQGVQRTGADIAVNDADGRQGHAGKAAFFMFRRQDCTRFCFVASHNMIGISK